MTADDADRSAEDVIASLDKAVADMKLGYGHSDWDIDYTAEELLATAARLLREAQADVDAATRLRAENERLQADINLVGRIARERDEAIDRALKVQVYNIHLRSAVADYLDPTKAKGVSSLREALNYDPAEME